MEIKAAAQKGRLELLEAMRDRLAAETDDETWAQHKRECRCACGIGDGRVLVALMKELRSVVEELESLPGAKKETELDRIHARARDDLAPRRARRVAGSPGSPGT